MVNDLLYSKAEQWFKRHTNGVTDITYYTGPIGSAIATGYVGLDEAGSVVGIVSLDALEREVEQSSVKPLLVVSLPFALTPAQIKGVRDSIGDRLIDHGWMAMILDMQPDRRVEAFGVDGKRMEAMPLDLSLRRSKR